MKNDKIKELKDNELINVSGGTAPELPATQLAEDAYNGMFSNPTNPGQYEKKPEKDRLVPIPY